MKKDGPSTEGRPMMRASQLHVALSLIDALTPSVSRQIRARYKPEYLAELAQATRLSWVPIEMGVELAVAYHAVLGDKAAQEWGRETMLHVIQLPWVRSIRDAAVRIFGLTPHGLYRFAPKMWDAVYRNSGSLVHIQRGSTAATIVLEDIPRTMLSAHGHLITVGGAVSAALDFCKVRGEIWLRPVTSADRRSTYDIVWDQANLHVAPL
jgi:hypothetical protein